MASISELLTRFPNGAEIAEALNLLARQMFLAARGCDSVKAESFNAFTITDSNGFGVVVVLKDGHWVTEPVEMANEAQHTADKVRQFACNLLRPASHG